MISNLFTQLMHILSNIWNKIYLIVSTPDSLESYTNVLSNIIIGVIAIIGIRYIKPLKDKSITATFNFWSQLQVRLTTIRIWLKQDCGLLDNLYSKNAKKEFTKLTPETTRIKEFKTIVEMTLKFIEDSNDQMPAYRGWSNDYLKIIEYLQDMIIFDICNNEHFFKFTTPTSDKQRQDYTDSICALIDKLCGEIRDEQIRIEKRLCKKKKGKDNGR